MDQIEDKLKAIISKLLTARFSQITRSLDKIIEDYLISRIALDVQRTTISVIQSQYIWNQ